MGPSKQIVKCLKFTPRYINDQNLRRIKHPPMFYKGGHKIRERLAFSPYIVKK